MRERAKILPGRRETEYAREPSAGSIRRQRVERVVRVRPVRVALPDEHHARRLHGLGIHRGFTHAAPLSLQQLAA